MKDEPHLPRAPVRLLLAVDSLQVGGGERQVADLAAFLHQRGYAVTVACSADGMLSESLKRQGVPVRVLMPDLVKRRVSLRYAEKLRALLREECFDLVHAHVYASAVASALATLGTNVPLVLTQHSESTWCGPIARLFSRWAFRRAQRVIAVSCGIRNLLIARYGVPPERVTVIPNAVTPEEPIAGDASHLPPEWSDGPIVGMVARLQREKGVRVFLEAIPSILTRVPSCRFLIVGDGPLRGELERRARARGVQDRVSFLGFQANARALVGKLDLLVLPSLSEGTPLVILEAMAAGVPVVASRIGGIPEQLRDGQDGLLVPPGDATALSKACIELLRDPSRAKQMGARGRRRAFSQFSYEAMVNRIERVYGAVLDATAQGKPAQRTEAAGPGAPGAAAGREVLRRPRSAVRSMKAQQAATVRQAGERDVEAILDLLTHYDLKRRHFEPWYYGDPEYRPEQSWVVERGGQLVAQLRVFDRLIRVAGEPLRIAGIGNVVTAREERGRGYVGRLLRTVVDGLSREPFAYSLLWTHVPRVYASQGWVPIPDQVAQGRISTPVDQSITIDRFEEGDLPEVARLYDETNAERIGPAVRSLPYWRAQRSWLAWQGDDFLVARRENGSLAGYLRSRRGTEFRELGIEQGDWDAGRALLAAVQKRHGGPLAGPLPPSLRDVFLPEERKVLDDHGLMGRTMNLEALVRSLGPLWARRIAEGSAAAFALETDSGPTSVEVRREGSRIVGAATPKLVLDEGEFGRLLFHGIREDADTAETPEELRALFPPQDFVIWGTDRF